MATTTTTTGSGPFSFKFLITSIDAKKNSSSQPAPPDRNIYGEDSEYIRFDGTTHSRNDDDMLYLMDVEVVDGQQRIEKSRGYRYVQFQAVSVTSETFKQKLNEHVSKYHNKKVLACMHGFNEEPASWMERCALDLQQSKIPLFKEVNPYILPVCWPTRQILFFRESQRFSKNAGKIFCRTIGHLDADTDFSLSLLCHSMAARVLMYFVKELPEESENDVKETTFDNVFIIAGDIWDEMFTDRVINDHHNGCWWPSRFFGGNEWKDAGLKLCRVMKKESQKHKTVHIYHHDKDIALRASRLVNGFRARLGTFGTTRNERIGIHEECKDTIRNVSMKNCMKQIGDEGGLKHGYQFIDSLVHDIAKCMKGPAYVCSSPKKGEDTFYKHALDEGPLIQLEDDFQDNYLY